MYLSDRRVDMFTVGGRNVYPPRSSALSAHPDVLSCLVVGVPDPNSGDLGQVPYALVHTADGSTLDDEGVKEFLRESISSYKVPHIVEFVDTRCATTPARQGARRCATRSWRD